MGKVGLVALLLVVRVAAARQEHEPVHAPRPGPRPEPEHAPAPPPSDLSHAREASGTAWLPDATPMHMWHGTAGGFEWMLHANAFAYYLAEGSDRGADELGSINWVMAMATHPLAGGALQFRAMLSAEPATVPGCGYPDLLATGEVCEGERIVDEQHPHDLFMELAARYRRPLAGSVRAEIYAAAAGEPALGPVAYPHRLSALPNPLAPITHHWMDATHISFGVLTAGVLGDAWKVEASLFNGREPDEERWDLDLARPDSFAARAWYLPTDRWALQVSGGVLNEAELKLDTGQRQDVWRTTASATHHRPLTSGTWATTLAWGRNDEPGEEPTNAFLLESALEAGHNGVFGRIEWVEKSTHDLDLEALGDQVFWVGKLGVGYLREAGPFAGLVPGVGAELLVSAVPEELEATYGARFPLGFVVFARLHLAGAKHRDEAPHHP